MNTPFPKKPLDLTSHKDQIAYVRESQNPHVLLQKEIDVNRIEQQLLQKRIQLMKNSINDFSSTDPRYSLMLSQIQMDQIELDELKIREEEISSKLETIK